MTTSLDFPKAKKASSTQGVAVTANAISNARPTCKVSRNVEQLFKDIKKPEESDNTEFQRKTNESNRDAPSAPKIVSDSQAASEPEADSEPEKLDPKTYHILFLVLRYDCSPICYCLSITFKIPDGTWLVSGNG